LHTEQNLKGVRDIRADHMAHRLTTTAKDFDAKFNTFLTQQREASPDVDASVQAIISDVRARGDAAVIELTQRYDGLALTADTMRVSKAEIDAACSACDPATLAALNFARDRIYSHHQRQLPKDDLYTDSLGATLGSRWTAVESVGLYVPGGLASYPSSVLMNACPAKVAGVPRIVMVVPSPKGELNGQVLAAARIAGVEEIYRIGGAQAVAALAYGTATIAPVVKIVGPGNAYVASAKRQVYGVVGIDSIAGPSEVLVIADKDNNPEWIAADLIAQAEHDTAAQSILMTDDAGFAAAVEAAVARQLATLPRGNIAGESWNVNGAVIVLRSMDLAHKIRNAGAIFLGRHTPEVIGDYVGGSNHVLPTARSAKFSSGLGVLDFMKRTSILKLDEGALSKLGPDAMTLARAEGLEGHRRSVEVRLGTPPKS
jgi:histidinol dehydrogenase